MRHWLCPSLSSAHLTEAGFLASTRMYDPATLAGGDEFAMNSGGDEC